MPGTPVGQAGEHEALTGDDPVGERQYNVEHLIMHVQVVQGRDAPCAGQVGMEAQPAVPLREDGFHEPGHDAVIARPSGQYHDGSPGAIRFMEKCEISEVTLHGPMPLKLMGARAARGGPGVMRERNPRVFLDRQSPCIHYCST